MEQMYASTALKLGLGYDAVQKLTPRGETRKFFEFFQVFDFRRHLKCSYKKIKEYEFGF